MGELPRGGAVAVPRETNYGVGTRSLRGGRSPEFSSAAPQGVNVLPSPDDHYPENMRRETGRNARTGKRRGCSSHRSARLRCSSTAWTDKSGTRRGMTPSRVAVWDVLLTWFVRLPAGRSLDAGEIAGNDDKGVICSIVRCTMFVVLDSRILPERKRRIGKGCARPCATAGT
jgi:hypothetical protein